MKCKYIIFSILLVLTYANEGFGQTFDGHLVSNYKIYDSDTNKLFLNIYNTNYLKNNEYFGKVIEGYTLFGFNFAPKVTYSPNSKIKLSAGANLLSYYSRNDETKISILLSFQYKLLPKLDFVLGNIYGTVNHKLIEPLFDYEHYLNNNIENGVQFLWNGERFKADLWLDWQKQIFYDDPFQEKFNVGLSANYSLFKNDNSQLSIPFQNLIRHEGGQINSNNDKPLKTIYNNAIGLSYLKNFESKFLHDLRLSSYWVNYQDLSPTKQQMFIDGSGSYSTLELFNNSFDFMLEYWYGEQFIAPSGNPLFESYSRTNIFVEEPVRQLIMGKISYHKDILEGLNLGFRFDSYYDLDESELEYFWSVLIVFNDKFLLRTF
jgi:hypothetical protein